MPSAVASGAAEQELVITRIFEAPRELVFRMWTDPKHAKHWWGPRDYPATSLTMDVRPGGRWRNCLSSIEDGRVLWQSGVFREVVAPERLVFTFAWDDDDKRGPETLVTVVFAEEKGKTRMTMWQTPFASGANRDGHGFGWNSTFNRLEDYLGGGAPAAAMAGRRPTAVRDMTITRIFDAPRRLLFKLWTDPGHLAQWWGPQGFTNPVCELDLRPGGRIFVVMRGPAGTDFDRDFPMSGKFHEIVEPDRLVFTAVAEDADGEAQLEAYTVVTFTAQGGKTRVTVYAKAVGLSAAAPQMLGGMQAGWTQSLEKLATLAAAKA